MLELQGDRRKSTCIIKEKHLIVGEIKEFFVVFLIIEMRSTKEKGNYDKIDPLRADAKIGLNMQTFY